MRERLRVGGRRGAHLQGAGVAGGAEDLVVEPAVRVEGAHGVEARELLGNAALQEAEHEPEGWDQRLGSRIGGKGWVERLWAGCRMGRDAGVQRMAHKDDMRAAELLAAHSQRSPA